MRNVCNFVLLALIPYFLDFGVYRRVLFLIHYRDVELVLVELARAFNYTYIIESLGALCLVEFRIKRETAS